jgi:hypothetical protein
VTKATFQVGGQVVATVFELRTLDSDLAKKFVHRILVVELTLFGLAYAALSLGIVANTKAHYDISSNLASVEGTIENSKFYGALREEAMQIQTVVAAIVIVAALIIFGMFAIVPSLLASSLVSKALTIESLDGGGAKLLAIALTMRINLDSLIDDILIRTHKVNQVLDLLDCVVKRTNVNVNAATMSCVRLCTSLRKKADKLLQIVHIIISKNRGNKFALGGGARGNYGRIVHTFPLATLLIASIPSIIAATLVTGLCTEVARNNFCAVLTADAAHFNFYAKGLIQHNKQPPKI